MSKAKPSEKEDNEDDEFDVGDGREADGGVNIPVTKFESKFLGAKEGNDEKSNEGKGNKDTLQELLNMRDDGKNLQ